MQKRDVQKLLIEYNGLYKQMDDIYHSLARHYGMSDCVLWILYIIRESDKAYTQSEICKQMSMSKQTVNSALKNLEKTGYIKLETCAENQKNKRILLTESGERFAQKTVDAVMQMEQEAFEQFTEEECAAFMKLNHKYVQQLQEQAEKILAEK